MQKVSKSYNSLYVNRSLGVNDEVRDEIKHLLKFT